ncbi:MAG: AIR synthase family protein [Thaumarchaeota archaeon]|nr:AIR synthase family protein [Nitrososphaerota archaeon]
MNRGRRSETTRRLPLGKIPIDLLDSTVLRLTGGESDRVATPPRAGVDFAAVKVARGFMIVSSDPISGVTEQIGRYAVKVSANDVATSGNRPEFAESVVLLPEGSSEADLRAIAKQVDAAAKESGIAILGGHTEVTPGLSHPIVVVTVFAFAEKYVTSGGAKAGDVILMTKTAGLEGTSELAREHDFEGLLPAATLRSARRLIELLDVTPEATAAFGTGRVHGMHDCTEGGVLGAVYEMSVASGLGFVLEEDAVPVSPETREICDALSIDPLRLIGSGSLIIAVAKGSEALVMDAVSPTSRVTRVGEFRQRGRSFRRRDGTEENIREAPEDELWRVLSRPR